MPSNQPPMNNHRTMLFDRSCYKLTFRCNEHELINTRGIQLILYLIRPAESEDALSNGYSRHRRHYVLFLYRWVGVCVLCHYRNWYITNNNEFTSIQADTKHCVSHHRICCRHDINDNCSFGIKLFINSFKRSGLVVRVDPCG